MDEILNYLQSPGWWFTTVFAAILVSLLAGFVKDLFNRWLSESWAWYRQRRAATLARKERVVEFLSREPTILSLYNSETTIFLIFSLFCLVLSILILVGTQSILASPELTLSFSKLGPLSRLIWTLMVVTTMLVFTLLAALTSFIFTSRAAVSTRASKRLYKRKFAEFERNAAPPEGK